MDQIQGQVFAILYFSEAASDAPLGLISCLGPGEDKYLTIPAAASSVRSCAGQRRVVEQTQSKYSRLKGQFKTFIKMR